MPPLVAVDVQSVRLPGSCEEQGSRFSAARHIALAGAGAKSVLPNAATPARPR